MKALNLLKTILENGLSSYNEEDDTVLVNGWWVTLEECIAELEALQQPKHDCDTCKWDDYCGTEENCLSSKYIKDRYEPKLKEQ